MNDLQTQNFFVDTSIFYKLKFQWDHDDIERLEQLAKSGKIYLYSTQITIQEIEKNIAEMVDQAYKASNEFRQNATILCNITDPPFKSVFVRLNKDEIKNTLYGRLRSFLESTKVSVVPIDGVSVNDIFSKYFSGTRPFSSSGKKKHEFPDAFVVAALENWCKKNDKMMYIVSGDDDMFYACETSTFLFPLRSIEALFDLITKHTKHDEGEEERTSFVIDLLDNHLEQIQAQIQKKFEMSGFWLEDQTGDVNSISVLDLIIRDKYLIQVEEKSAKFTLSAVLTISVDVTYDDLENAPYDSEDKVLVPLYTINEVIETEINLERIDVEIAFDINQAENFEIIDLNIEDNRDIGITVRR